LAEAGVERAAAALARQLSKVSQRVAASASRLDKAVGRLLEEKRRAWQSMDHRLRERDLRLRMSGTAERLSTAQFKLRLALPARMATANQRLQLLESRLGALSPLRVLERGYAIVEVPGRGVVKRAAEVESGEELRIRLHEGRLRARVEGREEG
jgi:exodeoxyribonuclease VII large subunit